MSESVKRRYDSPRRREQAAETRRQILAGSQRLFERDGYAATSVAAIAAEAGVALKTVYVVFGTKSGVLRALWNLLLRGDDENAPIAERDWYRSVLAEPDPERLVARVAEGSRTVKERVGGVFEVIRSAAPVDPDIAELWARIETDFYENQRAIVEALRAARGLRRGLDADRATDILWSLNHPDVWLLLVASVGGRPTSSSAGCARRCRRSCSHPARARESGAAGLPRSGVGVWRPVPDGALDVRAHQLRGAVRRRRPRSPRRSPRCSSTSPSLPVRRAPPLGEEPPTDVGDPERLEEPHEGRVPRGGRDCDVERAARVVRGVGRPGGIARPRSSSSIVSRSGSGASLRGQPGDRPARARGVPRAGRGRRRAPESATKKPAVDLELDEPVARQPPECLAHGAARDAEAVGELGLAEPRTGRERAADDQRADLVVGEPDDGAHAERAGRRDRARDQAVDG